MMSLRQLVILWMIVLLLDFSGAQQCISNCPTGEYIVNVYIYRAHQLLYHTVLRIILEVLMISMKPELTSFTTGQVITY